MRKQRLRQKAVRISVPKRYRVSLIIAISLGVLGTAGWLTYRSVMQANSLQSISDVQKDIPYCNSKNDAQTLDLYRPKDRPGQTVPLLVYVHGGGWRSGSKSNPLIFTYGPLFIKHGLAVASINYRLHTNSPYPDQNNDVACALDYLNEHAVSLKIDVNRTLYFGDSAGGQLAAFAALNIPYRNYDYDAPVGVIDFYGVSDFSKIVEGARPDFNARRYLGSKYNQVAEPASPTTYVTRKAPRFLFVHGTDDRVVPISQSKSLYDLLMNSGIDAEYLAIPGAQHGFRGPELSDDNYRAIRKSLDSFLVESLQ